ncbi:MAG: endonuclease III [Armatimonadota bacterium]|nr:endonuclease III [Armatimonadota bacterium]
MKHTERVCDFLESAYGRPEWVRHNPPLDELVLTILSQNTTSANCRRAFASLRTAFPTWEEVMEAPVERIAQSIHVGGLSGIKAGRIKQILRRIHEQQGRLELNHLDALPMRQALEYLSGFEGVGPKTAACVLLFSLGKPAMPVDTHVHRVSARVGLIPPAASAEAAHELLREIVPAKRVYSFHMNLVRLGREICRPREPRCDECVLNRECDFGRKRLGSER